MPHMTEWNWRYGSIEKALELLEKFALELTIFESDGKWYISIGETLLLEADNKSEVEIFIYGMALAYDAIPEIFTESLIEKIAEWKKTL